MIWLNNRYIDLSDFSYAALSSIAVALVQKMETVAQNKKTIAHKNGKNRHELCNITKIK